MTQSPLLTFGNTTLWLKVILSASALVLLYLRHKKGKAAGAPSKAYGPQTRAVIGLAVFVSFAAFQNFGSLRDGVVVHYGEMFHYYLGSKYFEELGYYDLYNAVIVADTEQGNALAGLPFYTDLKTYQNTPRETALRDLDRIKSLFSKERWDAFKSDVAFFKNETGMPRSPSFLYLLMDHGYNASPVSTLVLGVLTNAVPVTQVKLLAALDALLVVAMFVVVFRAFGFEMGALFSIYFFINILNGQDHISGGLLRYDWLFYVVVAVCLLEKQRHASSAFFLTLAAMMRVFPAVLFYGIAVSIVQKVKTTRAVDKKDMRFVLASGVTAVALFLLPAVSLGSVLQPWKDFSAKTELHDSGVYVNHLGLRGIVLFEPSHLSFERFVETFKSPGTNDIVRHWQDIKESELKQRRPIIVVASLFVLACVTAIIWKRKASAGESALWPLLLIYAMSYPSHYYYVFLCLFILLFFRRTNPLGAFVPLGLLLVFNIVALVTDYFGPSPIVFFTLVNIYLFVCLSSILGFEVYTSVFRQLPVETVASVPRPHEPPRDVKQRRRQGRARRK